MAGETMICPRCSAQVTLEGATHCAGCLLLAAAETDSAILSADEAPPCELLSIMGDTPRAVTFLGEQTWPVRRLVALKVFKTEVRQPGVPRHPHLAPVLERGRLGGRGYTMMPYFAGGTVIALSERHRLNAATRISALVAVVEALEFAHARSLTHGRLQPSNVLCEPHRPFLVQIVDFDGPALLFSAESFEARAREDLDAVIALANALLHSCPDFTLDLPATLRQLRRAAAAGELEKALLDLQNRIA